MSAKFVDALMGYDYYLDKRGEATIDDVNHFLSTHGREEIQLRTFGHYRKLLAHGFRSYIPINQFDVFQALGKLQMAADRRRYQRDKVRLSAQVSRDHDQWLSATVVDKSLVGVRAVVSGSLAAVKGETVWLKLNGYDEIPTISVWRRYDSDDDQTSIGLRAYEFLARYRRAREHRLLGRLSGLIEVSREREGLLDWGYLYRVSEKTNELLDGVSALIYAIDTVLDTEIQLARPVLASIRFGSPGALQIKVDFGVAEFVRVLVEKIQYWNLDRERLKQENRRRELENMNLGIDVLRNAINVRDEALEAGMTEDAIAAILDPIRRIFKCKKIPKELFRPGSPERGLLTHRVLPAVVELVAGDDPDFELRTSLTKAPVTTPHRKGSPPRKTDSS